MMTNFETDKIKQLSIRSRAAFCATCLEKVKVKFGLHSPEIDAVINLLWDFTKSNDLDEWEKKATEISPDTILEDHLDNNFEEYETLSVNQLNRLKDFYLSIPKEVNELISWSLEVGLANLYGSTGNFSESTFNAVENVIKIMKKLEISLPDIGLFTFSNFQEEFGWGKPFNKMIMSK